MKKYLLLLIATFVLAIVETANAKEWTFKMGGVRNVSFEIPNNFECDTIHNEYYIFKKDGMILTIETILIDNFNQKKATTMPDSILVPNAISVGREEPYNKPVSRIIMSKHNDGSIIRHYVFFNRSGIVILKARTPDCNWEEIDQIANTYGSHFNYGKLLLFILAGVIGIIPSVIIAEAMEYRKKNLQKFWLYCIIAFLMIVILSIVFSIWWGFSFWITLLGYILCSIALGYCFDRGIIIF